MSGLFYGMPKGFVPTDTKSPGTKSAGALTVLCYSMIYLLLATPIKPSSPDPKSQNAAGTGTDGMPATESPDQKKLVML